MILSFVPFYLSLREQAGRGRQKRGFRSMSPGLQAWRDGSFGGFTFNFC